MKFSTILKAAWIPVDQGNIRPVFNQKLLTEVYVFAKKICDAFISRKCKLLVIQDK